jgi:hypothetical protein
MKTARRKKALTLGELITDVYDVCGKRKGRALVQFAIKARLIESVGPRPLCCFL